MGVCTSIHETALQIECFSEARSRRLEKKLLLKEFLSAEAKAMQLLRQMPGRICTNGVTRVSSVFTKQGRKGINQDCMLVWEDFAAIANTVLCGVFDGHGPRGHLVARQVRDSLPLLLAWPSGVQVQHLSDNGNAFTTVVKEDDTVLRESMERSFTQMKTDIPSGWKEKIIAAYKSMDQNLKTHPKINSFQSGTTAITMVLQDKDLIVGNVGDSRAILATRAEDGSLFADQLTVDLKPNLPGELERIRSCKGRVFALEDEPEVARVWHPHVEMPGLAMSRALGDFCLKDYGLSAIPEVSYRRLTKEDEFIVLATDGIWDVLSNKDVIEIVSSAFPKESAAQSVVEAAVKRWKRKSATAIRDDCAVICFFPQKIDDPSKQLSGVNSKSIPEAANNALMGAELQVNVNNEKTLWIPCVFTTNLQQLELELYPSAAKNDAL